MNALWFFVALLVLAGMVLVSRASMYGRLFGDEHFVEIGRRVSGLKAAALARVIDSDAEPDVQNDPRILKTPLGLAIVYTIKKRETEFVHHCSVGATRSATAHAVGETFLLFVAKVLGLPIEKMTFEIADSTVHHAEAVVSEAEHAALAAALVVDVSMANVAELRRAAMETRDGIRWR
jgi:hypothetical protein